MIDLREIRDTIDEIKRHGTTVGQAEKLALLYIAADHMEREEAAKTQEVPEKMENRYSRAAAPEPENVRIEHKSEFLAACDGSRIEDVLRILDEHMEAIMVLYPKEYKKIISMIENKKSGRA